MNSPESDVPRLNPLEDSSNALLISDTTSECDESDESLFNSDDSSTE